MKTKNAILMGLRLALLGSYGIYSSIRVWQLREQLERLDSEQRAASRFATEDGRYSDTFVHYFGQKGVAEVERAREIMRQVMFDPRAIRVQQDGREYYVLPDIKLPSSKEFYYLSDFSRADAFPH